MAGAARAGAGRVTRLRHEAVDDAVERHAVVEATPCQRLDLRDMLRRQVGAHFDDDAAGRHVEVKGVFKIRCHGRASQCQGRDQPKKRAQKCFHR
jgi:hypothetical protein